MAQSNIATSIDEAERRTHGRLDRVHKLFLQVVDGRPSNESRLLRCSCENVSAGGLGVTLVEPVRAGTEVELWINVEDEEARFLLGGVVRWCRPATHRCLHEIGIELTSGESEELVRWKALWSERR